MHLVCFERTGPISAHPWGGGESGSRLASDLPPELDLDLLHSRGPALGSVLPQGPHAGEILDLNRALAIKLALADSTAPEVEADARLPRKLLEMLDLGAPAIDMAAQVHRWCTECLRSYEAPNLVDAGVVLGSLDARRLAPIPRPGKIIAIACDEGDERSGKPALFLKAPSAISAHDADIPLPSGAMIELRGALAVIVGRRGHHIEPGAAASYIAGFSVAGDLRLVDPTEPHRDRSIAASCDGFSPVGPVLVTADEIADPQALRMRTWISGELHEDTSTAAMQHSIAEVLSYASRLMTLEPGDMLLAGVPRDPRDPPRGERYLKDGDLFEVEIERVGRLRSFVRRTQEGSSGA